MDEAEGNEYGEAGICCFRIRCRDMETDVITANWIEKGDCDMNPEGEDPTYRSEDEGYGWAATSVLGNYNKEFVCGI